MPTHGFDACMMTTEACRRELGERVRNALQRLDWRQADLAAAAGVDKGAISRIVAGKRVPGQKRLGVIAGALGCTEDDLLPGVCARRGDGEERSTEYVRTAATRPGRMLVEIRRELPIAEAVEIQRLAEGGAS